MKILILGATGMLGRPVAQALADAGHDISCLVRAGSRDTLPQHLRPIIGDIFDNSVVEQAIAGVDAVHLSLSVRPTESKRVPHTEGQGLENIIAAAERHGIGRITYLSSLVQQCNSDWWVFALKRRAVARLAAASVPSLVFRPSTFMEALPHQYLLGRRLLQFGRPAHPFHWIAAADYAQQVVRSYTQPLAVQHREYVVQGPEAISVPEAMQRFAAAHPRVKVTQLPLLLANVGRLVSRQARYGYHIAKALNTYPETFDADDTWADLGRPTTTIDAWLAAQVRQTTAAA